MGRPIYTELVNWMDTQQNEIQFLTYLKGKGSLRELKA